MHHNILLQSEWQALVLSKIEAPMPGSALLVAAGRGTLFPNNVYLRFAACVLACFADSPLPSLLVHKHLKMEEAHLVKLPSPVNERHTSLRFTPISQGTTS